MNVLQREDPSIRFRLMPKSSAVPLLFRYEDLESEIGSGAATGTERWAPLIIKATATKRRDARFYLMTETQTQKPFVGMAFPPEREKSDGEPHSFFLRKQGFPPREKPVVPLPRASQSRARADITAVRLTNADAVNTADVIRNLREWWIDLPRRTWEEWLDLAVHVQRLKVAVERFRLLRRFVYDPLEIRVSDFMEPRAGNLHFNAVVGGRKVIHRVGNASKKDGRGAFVLDLSTTRHCTGKKEPLSISDIFDYLIVTCPAEHGDGESLQGTFVFSRDILIAEGVLADPTNHIRGRRQYRVLSPKARPMLISTQAAQAWQSHCYVDLENSEPQEYLRRFSELFVASKFEGISDERGRAMEALQNGGQIQQISSSS